MGRTKGTLICPKCRRTNPATHDRAINGCRGHLYCDYKFPEDEEYRKRQNSGLGK